LPATADGPSANEVKINGVNYGGYGCPVGSVAADIEIDAKELNLYFDRFVVEASGNLPRNSNRQRCYLTINLYVPQGWSYALSKAKYFGFAVLDAGTSGGETSSYTFEGNTSSAASFTMSLTGPYAKDFQITDELALGALVWSPCGARRALNINTTKYVTAPAGKSALLTTEEDLMHHIFTLSWRRC
jgi:hypothetical protein